MNPLPAPSPVASRTSVIVAAGRQTVPALAHTSLGHAADEPVQVFHAPGAHPASAARLPWIDLGALPPERREAESERLAAAEARRPFDLARGPLFRNLLARLDDRRHLLIQNLHHIVSDGWARGLLVRDLVALYGALAAGRPPELPAPPVQYGDFCLWQRRRLTAEALAGSADFWRRALDGARSGK